MLSHYLRQAVRQLGVDSQVLLPVEHVAQHGRDDTVPAGAAVIEHLRDHGPDAGSLILGHCRQPVRKRPVHRRQGEERPGGLQ